MDLETVDEALERIRSRLSVDGHESRVVICGSWALKLRGIDLGRPPGDVDVRLLDVDVLTAMSVEMPGEPRIDKLYPDDGPELEYGEMEFGGNTYLVQTVRNAVDTKRHLMEYLLRTRGEDSRKYLKAKSDLGYLKEKYGIEPS